MERTTFLEHYRISNEYDGSAIELARTGSAITYRAADLRSGALVALTLLPIASVDTAVRERFEEQARASEQLDHINIARIFAFGIVDDQFAFVQEYPQGETVESWIGEHGPMPPDAVLRVALQVVSALSAGSFYGLTHPAIQPSNLMIVAGKTAEGGWPRVKLMNFGLAGLKLAPAEPGKHAVVSEFASPEQLQQGTTDFRSEIYSLGATMCFILTGAFYSAEPRSLQTRRFARPLRNLIAPMLHQNPDERPQDPVLVAQALRSCLQRVERRQALAQRFGIPFVAVKARRAKPRPHPVPVPLEADMVSGPAPIAVPVPGTVLPIPITARPRSWLLRRAVAVAALLLVLATAAALLLPAPVSMILHRNRDKAPIGVPVGIPESSAMAMAQNSSSATAPVPAAPPVQSPPGNLSSPSSSVPIENKVVGNASQTVSPGQTTGQPAPASSPAVANRNENAAAVAHQPVAQTSPVVNQPTASAQQNAPTFTQQTQSGGAEASPSTSRSTVAADAATPPAAPAEGPQTVWEREAGAKQNFATRKANDDGDGASASAPEQRDENATSKSNVASSKSRSKPKEVASNTRRSATTRYDRSRTLQVPPDQEDRYQPPYQPYREDQRPRPRRALPGGSFRAQVVGTTPEGDLILRLPSGEIVVAPPRHRPRRILVERPGIPMPPPPQYLPAYPSGD
jgi:serine/threonine protein kinase